MNVLAGRLCDFPDMGNFARTDFANTRCKHCDDRDSVASKRHEFYGISHAVFMNRDDRADITGIGTSITDITEA